MSFLNWFNRKGAAPESMPSQHSGLSQADVTVPMHRPGHAAKPADANGRRSERLERRELLYGVVRECMTGAGVLSSTYKFKVLSLDAGGRQYLIMVDMPRAELADPAQFSVIEGSIARSAKERYDILVTAMYWRINDQVSSGNARQGAPVAAAGATPLTEPSATPVSSAAATEAPDAQALLEEEVLAFKRAVAAGARNAAPVRAGEVVHSGRFNPEPVQDFSDTEPFDTASPLGASQFGGLN
jgi:hypothetical protein